MEQKRTNTTASQDDLQIKDIISVCLAKWYWFALSLAVCLGLATIKILRTPNVYTTSAAVLIKESRTRNSTNNIENMLTGGVNSMSSKLANEIAAFKSPALMSEVVSRLDLDIQYSVEGRFHNDVIYGAAVPIIVSFIGEDWPAASFKVRPSGTGLEISEFTYAAHQETIKSKGLITGALSDTLETPAGKLKIEASGLFKGESWEDPILVSKRSNYSATEACSKRLSVSADDMKNLSDVLNLSYKDVSPARAEEILNTLINVYNESWVEDNNKMAISTSEFITERLAMLEQELGDVDENISDYKSRNRIPDLKAASNLYMTESKEISKDIQEIENQIYVAGYIRSYLTEGSNSTRLIPMSTGLADATLSNQVNQYNNLLLQRNTLLSNSSANNPLVIDLNNSLADMKVTIVEAIDNQIETLKAKEAALQETEHKANLNIAANPNQEKYLLSVERQQKVKESLYLFLLQKREENELTQAFTAYNTKVITPPITNKTASEPQKKKILLMAFMLGLCIPLGVLYLRIISDTKVRSRKDIENLTIPFLGEIPQHYVGKRKPLQTLRSLRKASEKTQGIVVDKGRRDITNEAFRVLRTNLEFMSDSDSKVIVNTSFNPGSGKTFITINLASALAIKGHKVLIIDGDLRKATMSEFVGNPRAGLADYLAGKESSERSLIATVSGYESLSILPVGTVPPNPSELLGSPRFAEMIGRLRSDYDYVFIDCPPIDIVADTQIMNAVSDRTLFTVRAGLLEKNMLDDLQKIYDSGRLHNMVFLLNGTETANGRYGYNYGYHYGYGYGKNSYGYK